ncbi:MAG: Xaa-Pro peptidase family protein, partial [Clostridia bacterium]|nr:Xaa-Pro peptidase family protein [Clostridia bacterium]
MRVNKLRAAWGEAEAFLLARPENRFYFSGFTGTEGSALILPDKQLVLVDFRYVEQALAQCQGWEVIQLEQSLYKELPNILARENITKLALEGDFWTYDDYLRLQKSLPKVTLLSLPQTIENLRLIKEANEIERIARAVSIGDQAFEQLLPLIKPGVREQDLALELEFLMRKQGASETSFTTIVASGSRAALPHGTASDKKLAKGDLVVLDFGCVWEHYCSDMTRTVAVGQAGAKEKEIYQIVLEAQLAGLEILKA